VVRAHLSIFVHALFGFALTMWQHMRFDPIKRARKGHCVQLVHLLKVDDETIKASRHECIHTVEVGVNHLLSFRIFANHLVALLRGEQQSLVANHLPIEATLRFGIAGKRAGCAHVGLVGEDAFNGRWFEVQHHLTSPAFLVVSRALLRRLALTLRESAKAAKIRARLDVDQDVGSIGGPSRVSRFGLNCYCKHAALRLASCRWNENLLS
jgi:hypothetical protein